MQSVALFGSDLLLVFSPASNWEEKTQKMLQDQRGTCWIKA